MLTIQLLNNLESQFIKCINEVYETNFILLDHAVLHFKQICSTQKRLFADKWIQLDKSIGIMLNINEMRREEHKTFSYTRFICAEVICRVKQYVSQCINDNAFILHQNRQKCCKQIISQTFEHFDNLSHCKLKQQFKKCSKTHLKCILQLFIEQQLKKRENKTQAEQNDTEKWSEQDDEPDFPFNEESD
ncbi:Hypothetical_protein [Hexamita inflata]|uniref:Hypothetical_protein n=1 Tax=Hexamita inflata TaxID=28002 RepID=A0AA86U8W1_9EUKA|nr:Hypothetical protein HINF_LOCUS33464 [Hexamita inflata]CAI9956363.1 Hypothetical protein HINF_LOCUS44008 [Hexamita inflata]